jgi:MoxR-like ATPase
MADKTEKIVYITVKSVSQQMNFYSLPGQTVLKRSDNSQHQINPELPVSPRIDPKDKKENEVWATNDVTLRDDVFYVMGSKLFKVTDATGKILKPTGDAFQDEAIKGYESFKKGFIVLDAEELAESTAKRVPLLHQLMNDVSMKPPTIEDDGFYVDEDLWYYLLVSMINRKNIILTGDTGCGKTDLCFLVGKKINKKLEIFDMAISNPVTTLCGNQRISAQGHSEYQYARFARKLSGYDPDENGVNRKGYFIVLDELSRAQPSASNILLPLTDKRRTLYIENAMHDSQIIAQKDTCIWATANIGAKFTGTQAMDAALMDRFEPQHIDYPPFDKELLVVMKKTNIFKSQAKQIVDFATKIRSMGELSLSLSTRQVLSMGELVYDGFTIPQAANRVVLNKFETDEHDGGERALVAAIIQQM